MKSVHGWRLPVILAAAVVSTTCGGDAPPQGESLSVPLLRLAPAPSVEIGVVDGDPVYELHRAVSSIRLDDGRIVISNAGTELLCFDHQGRLVWKSGRRGSGPGEFRNLSRLYHHGPDSILALDQNLNRVSVLGADGAFARMTDAVAISRDSTFSMDVWLHGRFWVDGALRPERRQAVREVLDRLPPPRSAPGYRFVQVDVLGYVWIREPLNPDEAVWHWTIVDESGRVVNSIDLPLRFEPHHIDRDFILGRWRDENDVNFIRLYEVQVSDVARPAPAWLADGSVAAAGEVGGDADEAQMLALLQGSLRNVVLAQESYFVDHSSYTFNRHDLLWEQPEGVTLDIIAADRTGWSAVAAHRDLERICGMAVGSATPPGWMEGVVRCG